MIHRCSPGDHRTGPRQRRGKHFVGGDPEGKDIDPDVGRFAANNFRRHVERCSGTVSRSAKLRSIGNAQAEINQLDCSPIFTDDKIPRTNIAMDKAPLVNGRQGGGHLPE